jgi:hypothetical protein
MLYNLDRFVRQISLKLRPPRRAGPASRDPDAIDFQFHLCQHGERVFAKS